MPPPAVYVLLYTIWNTITNSNPLTWYHAVPFRNQFRCRSDRRSAADSVAGRAADPIVHLSPAADQIARPVADLVTGCGRRSARQFLPIRSPASCCLIAERGRWSDPPATARPSPL
jgi:hypothetical protein